MKSNVTTFEREDERIAEANRRLEIVETFLRLIKGDPAQGILPTTPRAVYSLLKKQASRASVDRYVKAYQASGGDFNALIPGTDRCGRKSKAELCGLTEELGAMMGGLALDTGSVTSACRAFAQSERCPEALAQAILDSSRTSKHSIPPSIRAVVKQGTNQNMQRAHRGPRALSLRGMWTPRRNDILPGDIFTSDDTTPIWAWWVPWIESKEYPFGVKVLQGQFLPIMDCASQCIIAFVIIAREASSYRACDIWSLFGHTFDTIGLPRLGFQLERGSWEANVIRGEEVEVQEGEVSLSRRLGGLRQLPSHLTDWHETNLGEAAKVFPKTLQTWTSFLPKSKSIEAAFNRMQTLEGTLWGSLGRNQQRNPYEKAKKIYEACKRGAADPRLHFLSGDEIARRLRGILDYLNNEPMEGEVFSGVPRAKFDQAVTERPLFRMPEDLAYLYRRNWKIAQIDRGWARVRHTHAISGERYSLWYTNPSAFAGLEGKSVLVYYDREHFETPAQIHTTDGEFLCVAEYQDRVGSFLDCDTTGHELRRQWKNAVTSIYGTLAAHAPSRQMPVEIQQRRAEAAEANRIEQKDAKSAKGESDDEGRKQSLVTSSPAINEGGARGATIPTYRGSLRMQMLAAEGENQSLATSASTDKES